MKVMRSDLELLREYVEDHSETAFVELVDRHLNMVWGVAQRTTKDADLASDVAQEVFSDLAQKSSRLSPQIVLAAWLHRAASLAAAKCVRTYVRRSERERKAMDLHHQNLEQKSDESSDALLPLLDEGLECLSDKDRHAVVLRFFGHKSFAAVGTELGVSEDTAQKRVSRAIEKLRNYFRREGIAVGTATISSSLSAASAYTAPTELAAAVIVSSTGGITTLSASTLLIHKLQYQFLLMKTKLIVSVVAVSSITAPLFLQHQAIGALKAENARLEQQLYPIEALQAIRQELQPVQALEAELERLRAEQPELAALRQEATQLKGPDWEERRQLYQQRNDDERAWQEAKDTAILLRAEFEAVELHSHTRKAMLQIGLAARVWATDNENTFPQSFIEMTNELANNYQEGFEGGLRLEDFAWVPHARAVSQMEPHLALFREKTPRQMPDGTWERCYTLCDGSAHILQSDSPDFSEHEAHMIAADPEIPEQFRNNPAYQRSPAIEGSNQ